jgi:hypothetical protein
MVLRLPDISVPRSYLAVIATLILITVSCASSAPGQLPTDEEAAQVVSAYLEAVEGRDRAAILALVPAGNDADEEVEEKLRTYGGRGADSVTPTYASDFGGSVKNVSLVTDGETARVEKIMLVAEGGRWYLALGSARGARPGAATESPG